MPLSAQQLAAQKNLSYVLAEKLAQRILKGEYEPGTILPVDLGLCRHLCGADPEYRHRRRPHRGDLGMRGIYGVAVFYLIQNRQSCKIHLRLPLRDFGPC